MQGQFISLEGGEGTGKSTLITGLQQRLEASGIKCLCTREPGGTPLAERLRNVVLAPETNDTWSGKALALLMNAARDDHVRRVIKPALEAQKWVLCDRFMDSTRVYQSLDGVSAEFITAIEAEIVSDCFPNLTLILDADPGDLLMRRHDRAVEDVFEKRNLDFHRAVRQGFLVIARNEPERCVILDALQSETDVLECAMTAIWERLG